MSKTKVYIALKVIGAEPTVEELDFGVAFTKENLDTLEWLYAAKSLTDAEAARDNLFKNTISD